MAFAIPASAHAYPVHYQPGSGCTMTSLPSSVIMDLSEGVTAATLQVTNTNGQSIATGPVQYTSGKPMVEVPISQSASPGTYVVQWQFTSVDTHVTNSSWTFTYNPQAQGLDDQHNAHPACGSQGWGDVVANWNGSTSSMGSGGTNSKSSSSSTGIIIIVVVAVIVVGGGIAFAVTRKSSAGKP